MSSFAVRPSISAADICIGKDKSAVTNDAACDDV